MTNFSAIDLFIVMLSCEDMDTIVSLVDSWSPLIKHHYKYTNSNCRIKIRFTEKTDSKNAVQLMMVYQFLTSSGQQDIIIVVPMTVVRHVKC